MYYFTFVLYLNSVTFIEKAFEGGSQWGFSIFNALIPLCLDSLNHFKIPSVSGHITTARILKTAIHQSAQHGSLTLNPPPSILKYWNSVPLIVLAKLPGVCSTVFFLVFHMAFTPRVVFACIRMFPVDIMVTELQHGISSHAQKWFNFDDGCWRNSLEQPLPHACID